MCYSDDFEINQGVIADMQFKSRFLVVAVMVLALSAVAGGIFSSRHSAQPAQADLLGYHGVTRNFSSALQVIDDHYIVTPDKERLTKASVLGMLHTLDPHSSFFDRREFNEMNEEKDSEFFGIGVTINIRNGRIYVIGVGKDMPAERAGLRYGDAIVAVDGKSAKGWTQSDALRHVRGERLTSVDITVERVGEPEPLTMHVVRDKVPFPSVRNHFMIRPTVGYIGLTGGFNKTTSDELRSSMAELRKEGMTSLILDLRRNPGGLLRQAIQVSEEFLPQGLEILTVRGREGRAMQVHKSTNSEPETMPLVVLINRDTASASEIVAGAIQDQDRGLIVGEESFGKGLVQQVLPLPSGTGLTLTTQRYYTPTGRSIQREYNGVGLYDYYYARRNAPSETNQQPGNGQSEPAPPATRQGKTFYTPTGREVRGGGGISPNIAVKLPEEDVRWRDACFEFARRLVAGVLPGLEQYKVAKTVYGYHLRGQEYALTETVLTTFRTFLREHPGFSLTEAQLNSNLDYVRRRIRAEVITAAYGIEVADQFLLESDVQALAAVEAIPKAKHLTDTARLFATPLERH